MATHFVKFRGIKKSMGSVGEVPTAYMKKMIVREPVDKSKNLHPKAKARWNKITATPEPLRFAIHDMRAVREAQNEERVALGLQPKNWHLAPEVDLENSACQRAA